MMYFMGFDLYFFATYRHMPRKKMKIMTYACRFRVPYLGPDIDHL